ncbi:MAG: MGMT family protein [Clostridia bacterium]|nr:MGMT family protein [Clostridia bacterium]
MSMKQKVYEYLTAVPKGKVVTYSQIAEYLGNKKLARAVGNILHNNPDPEKYPCYKVVNSKGRLAENFGDGGIEVQKSRLEKDGIEVVDYKVDLGKYQM